MKNLIILILASASSLSFSAPTWIEYLIKVDSAQNAAKIVAATDKFMESDFVKNNFKGSLEAYIAVLHKSAWLLKEFLDGRTFEVPDNVLKTLSGASHSYRDIKK